MARLDLTIHSTGYEVYIGKGVKRNTHRVSYEDGSEVRSFSYMRIEYRIQQGGRYKDWVLLTGYDKFNFSLAK